MSMVRLLVAPKEMELLFLIQSVYNTFKKYWYTCELLLLQSTFELSPSVDRRRTKILVFERIH